MTEEYDRYKYWFRVTPINANKLVQASLLMLAQVSQEVREELGIQTPKVAIVVEQAVAGGSPGCRRPTGNTYHGYGGSGPVAAFTPGYRFNG